MSIVPISQPMAVDPFDRLVHQADILSKSSIIPKQYRGKPHDIIAAGMLGADFGWSPTTAMRLVHVVEGKPTVSAEGMVALARANGHSISGEVSSQAATVVGTRADNGDTMTVTFTIDDAARAGLAGRGPWKQHTASMLWARAVSHLCRRLFPDVTLGLYSEGELSPPPAQPDSRPAAVTVLDTDTGEVVELTQPPTVEKIPQDVAETIVDLFSKVGVDYQEMIEEWLCSYGDDDECWSVAVDDLVELPGDIGVSLLGLIDRARNAERDGRVAANEVESREFVLQSLNELDEDQSERFKQFRKENGLPVTVRDDVAAKHLVRMESWLRAEFGQEPFLDAEVTP